MVYTKPGNFSEATTGVMSEQMTEAEAHEAMDEQYAEQQREARLEALAAQSGPELLGMPHFEDGEQLGCDECG